MDPEYLAFGLVWYVVFLFSTTCHEAAHALVSKLGGDLTAFHGGQVTLNPAPHVRREPFGMILVPILTYVTQGWMMGWASAPYDPYWSHRHPHRAAWMSLAGPAANFCLALAAGIAIHAGILAGVLERPTTFGFSSIVAATSPGAWEGAAQFISLLFSLNVLLGAFNLLPLPPLDGFTAVGLFLSENAARKFAEWSHGLAGYSFLGIIVAWYVFGNVYVPVFRFFLRLVYWA